MAGQQWCESLSLSAFADGVGYPICKQYYHSENISFSLSPNFSSLKLVAIILPLGSIKKFEGINLTLNFLPTYALSNNDAHIMPSSFDADAQSSLFLSAVTLTISNPLLLYFL